MSDHQGRTPRLAQAPLRTAAVLAVAALALLGLAATASAKNGTTWLCKPGLKPDPCLENREANLVTFNGTTREETIQKSVKGRPAVDCFYVYPTVSEQEGPNANLTIEPQETQVAIDQASRFSQLCKVYAPMYPQLTLDAIKTVGGVSYEDELKAYTGVRSAFLEYLHKYNKGRGIVLIGHSQGSLMLEQLIKEQFDAKPSLRKQLVSADLMGGNVLVPEGQLEGGTFEHVPACTSASEVGCVIAYSTFLKEPPAESFFGRPDSPLLSGSPPPPGSQVLCVNPTLLTQNGGVGNLLPYAPTKVFPGVQGGAVPVPKGSTAWVTGRGLFTAQCKNENGASWLQISTAPGVSEELKSVLLAENLMPEELIGAEWGLHLYDVNIALGNLVNTLAVQIQAYGFES
jgi:hypothetical protein